MRVIRPQDIAVQKKPKKKRLVTRVLVVVLLFGGLGFAGYRYYNAVQPKPSAQPAPQPQANEIVKDTPKTGAFKTYSGDEFIELAQSVRYPNTQSFEVMPPIMGNEAADKRIRELAEKRGYRLTSIPVSPIEKLNEPRLDSDDLLQPLAAQGWRELKTAAERDQMPISLLSAYRSPEFQRSLFASRLSQAGATVTTVAAGKADAIVESVLTTTAVPGFSRHHTGYTIDLWCEDGSAQFVDSTCFDWISKDNYKIAKETGWIPSYPEGAKLQGPEPEPWEYVWVGQDTLRD
jgi:LAS superfamily LD-carboxypeptidase LdcB